MAQAKTMTKPAAVAAPTQVNPLLERNVMADEIDSDPEELCVESFNRGLNAAALIVSTQWAGAHSEAIASSILEAAKVKP